MTELLKLSCWFGERDRVEGGLLSDALLQLLSEQQIEMSVLLRGIEGFGLRHHLRTDRLLTLSEDLPAVVVALDTQERIEALLPHVAKLKRRGLITVERATLIDTEADLSNRIDDAHALKLTLHLPRHHSVNGKPAFVLACEILHEHHAAGATVLLGVDGTSAGVRRRARLIGRNEKVPMLVMSVGRRDPILASIPELRERLPEAVLTVERVLVCRRDGESVSQLAVPQASNEPLPQALWQKLTVVASEAALHQGAPLHEQLVRGLREAGAAGVTALRGVWGFHGDHAPHGDRLLSLRRHVPVLSVIVDTPERIARCMPIVSEVTSERGLVTSELVPVMRSAAADRELGSLRLPLAG